MDQKSHLPSLQSWFILGDVLHRKSIACYRIKFHFTALLTNCKNWNLSPWLVKDFFHNIKKNKKIPNNSEILQL